jgi:hypothetical protein
LQSITRRSFEERLSKLGEDIIDSNFHPKLGGSYQDKICAAFLFNNQFSSVQNIEESERHKMYYPWLKIGLSHHDVLFNNTTGITEYEISYGRLSSFSDSKKYYNENIYEFLKINEANPNRDLETSTVFFKKFIHLWIGEEAILVNDDTIKEIQDGWENPSRFKFALVEKGLEIHQSLLRAEGIVRIVEKDDDTNSDNIYLSWLKKIWLKKKQACLIIFRQDNHSILDELGKLKFVDNQIRYINCHDSKYQNQTPYADIHYIDLIHNPENFSAENKPFCRYRTHGPLLKHFDKSTLSSSRIKSNDLATELFEVLMTKICIFETRLFNRIHYTSPHLRKVLNDQLFINVNLESKDDFENMANNLTDTSNPFFDYHFLIIHLSFIEAFRTIKGERLSVAQFIEEKILRGVKKVPKNFIIVITTGRGRTSWWHNLKDEKYKYLQFFTTFKPIEDLLEAVENATSSGDDFEIKYNLVKALFGS